MGAKVPGSNKDKAVPSSESNSDHLLEVAEALLPHNPRLAKEYRKAAEMEDADDPATDVAIHGVGSAEDALALLVAYDPAIAVKTVLDDPSLPSPQAMGVALSEAKMTGEYLGVGSLIGAKAAFHAYVDQHADPDVKKAVAIQVATGFGSHCWHDDRIAFNIKVRQHVHTDPVAEEAIKTLGLDREQLWEDFCANGIENMEQDWVNLQEYSPEGSKTAFLRIEGRSGGWAVPGLNGSAITPEELRKDIRDLRDDPTMTLKDTNVLRHAFLLAQMECVVEECMTNVELNWNGWVQDAIYNKLEDNRGDRVATAAVLEGLERTIEAGRANGLDCWDLEKAQERFEQNLASVTTPDEARLLKAAAYDKLALAGNPYLKTSFDPNAKPDGTFQRLHKVKDGHSFWLEGGTGRPVVADNSIEGGTPRSADDGVLYLDMNRPIKLSFGRNGGVATLPLLTPKGETSGTPMNSEEVNYVRKTWGLPIIIQD